MISIIIIMVTTPLMFLHALSLPSINALGSKVDQGYSESALSVRRDVNQSIPPHFEISYCIENNSRKRLIVQVICAHLHDDCLLQVQNSCTLQRYSFLRNNDQRNSRKKLFIANSML